MRFLKDHVVDGDSANHQVKISVVDLPGAGGANHEYRISWEKHDKDRDITLEHVVSIDFQNGPIKEVGVNGLTQEALLAITIDRMRSFQAGPYACDANQRALEAMLVALSALQERTRERIARGVEGTHTK
jgi:hypothetical protein